MAFNPFTIIKSLLIKEENTLTPKTLEIIPGGTASTKTTIVGSQTTDKTITLPDATDTLIGKSTTDTLTNKTIDADGTGNVISNIDDGNIKAGAAIDASKIADGSVSNTEFQYINSVTSNVQTQLDSKQATGNYITALTGDVVATGPGSVSATIQAGAVTDSKLATGINANKIGAGAVDNTEFSYLDGVTSAIQTQLDAKLNLSGGTLTGNLILNADPSGSLGAATKQYVDSVAAGLDPKASCRVATTTSLGGSYATTPSNGQFTGAATTIDGVSLSVGDRVLVKDQSDAKQNGIYTYTASGEFTRASDMDGSPASEVSAGNYSLVTAGTLNIGKGYVVLGTGILTLNTDNISWTNFSGASAGATMALDNLASVAINTSLLPATTNSIDLGSSSKKFKDAYVAGDIFVDTSVQSPSGSSLLVKSADPSSGIASNSVTLRSGNTAGLGVSGAVIVSSGTSASGSGIVTVSSGADTGGGSGDLNLQTGTSTSTRGKIKLDGNGINIVQGNSATAVSGQQSLTIPSSGSTEGLILVTASDSTVREVLTAGPEGLPQAPNLIRGGDAEGKLTSSTSILTPYEANQAVTFTDAGDLVTLVAHGLSTGNTVAFTTITSTTGISTGTTYYAIFVSSSTFQLASSLANAQAGTALALTTNGSGAMVRGMPLTGTGGSPSVSSAVVSSGTLTGSKSYNIVKAGSNYMGQGWSTPNFTVPVAYRAKVLTINFDYLLLSGTFNAGTPTADSDVTVWIYDITNSTLIQPSSYKLLSNSTTISDRFQAEFQTSATGSSYRLIYHIATPNANAYTLTVDNIVVSPSKYVFGSPISDWQLYTPITQGFGTITGNSFLWRRTGDSIEIKGTFTTGTPTATEAQIGLPSGFSIDSTKFTAKKTVGTWTRGISSATHGGFVLATGGDTFLNFGADGTFGSSSLNAFTDVNGTNMVSGAGESTSFFATTIPVVGLSSSVQMSDQTSTRVVAARYVSATATITSSYSDVTFTTSQLDTHAMISGATATLPVAGNYSFTGQLFLAGTGALNNTADVQLLKNGATVIAESQFVYAGAVTAAVSIPFVFKDIPCISGDTFKIQVKSTATTPTISASSTQNFLQIERLSGPSQIAASETVAASYWLSASFAGSATTPFNFDSKEIDTHNAVTTSATAWKFTAPSTGIYQVSGYLIPTSSGTYIQIYKNGSAYKSVGYVLNGTVVIGGLGSVDVPLNSGEYIDIRPISSLTVTGGSLNSQQTGNITINKIGNRG